MFTLYLGKKDGNQKVIDIAIPLPEGIYELLANCTLSIDSYVWYDLIIVLVEM